MSRRKAPSEGLERGTGRFQLNGTDSEGPARHWEAEGRDRFMVASPAQIPAGQLTLTSSLTLTLEHCDL